MSTKKIIECLEKNGLPTPEELTKIANKVDDAKTAIFFVYAGDSTDRTVINVKNDMSAEAMDSMVFNTLVDYVLKMSETIKLETIEECKENGTEVPENIDGIVKIEAVDNMFNRIQEFFLFDPDVREAVQEMSREEAKNLC